MMSSNMSGKEYVLCLEVMKALHSMKGNCAGHLQ